MRLGLPSALVCLLCACDDPRNDVELPDPVETDADTDADADADADADTDTPTGTEHCGEVRADETWEASGNPHRVVCDLEVLGGATLTWGAGVVVLMDDRVAVEVASSGEAGSLVVAGTRAEPVVARSAVADEPGRWDGFDVDELGQVALSNLQVQSAGAGRPVFRVSGELDLDGLEVDGSEEDGIELREGASFADGSAGLVVSGVLGWPVVLEADAVHTLPLDGLDLTDNELAAVRVEGGTLDTARTWADPGVPYVLGGDLDLEGTVADPAILTLGPGVVIAAENDVGIDLSPGGGASGLRVLGTGTEPVRLTAWGAEVPGYWDGIRAHSGTLADAFTVTELTLSWAGGGSNETAIEVEDADVFFDHLTVEGSAGYGLAIEGDGRFSPGSSYLTVVGSLRPLRLPAEAVGSLDGLRVDLGDNDDPLVEIDGGPVATSAVWPTLDVPYLVEGTVSVDGTADRPAVLTLDPGMELLMGRGASLQVGKTGAAALIAQGTSAAPIVFGPALSEVAGAWGGVGLYDASDDAQCVLDHVEIGWAGGSGLSGNLHLDGASPRVDHAYVHDSEEYGIYARNGSSPLLGSVTYANNASGDYEQR